MTTSLLRDFASRLRYVPAEVARKQLQRAEELADEVFDDVASGKGKDRPYPAAWVLGRITGYEGGRVGIRRADGGTEKNEIASSGEMIVGSALLADLCSLVEHLSEAAKLGLQAASKQAKASAKQCEDDGFTIEDLCTRWGVSRKSVERWRKEGLYARRVRGQRASASAERTTDPGLGRLIYAREVVERFERARGFAKPADSAADSKPRKAAPRRLSEKEKSQIVQRAKRYRSRMGWSLGPIAAQLSERYGCSAETIRRILRAHEESSAQQITPRRERIDRPTRERLTGDYQRGGSVKGIAESQSLSRASVYRHVWQRRLEQLRTISPAEWGFISVEHDAMARQIVSPMFERSEAEEVFLGAAVVTAGAGTLRFDAWPRQVAALVAEARGQSALAAQDELQCASAFRYLLWRAKREFDALAHREGARPNSRAKTATHTPARLAGRVEQIETWLVWTSRLKAALTRSQLGLVVRTIESTYGRTIDEIDPRETAPLIEAALQAAMEGVDRFDPFHGGRLAAPAALAIGRAVSRWRREHDAQPTGKASRAIDPRGGSLSDFSRHMHRWQGWIEPSEEVQARILSLVTTDDVRRVMCTRWGWGKSQDGVFVSIQRPRSAAETGLALGLSVKAVRILERRAHAKIG